jgi:hypothetical protein
MLHILHHLNYVPVIVVTVLGFAFGALWYSQILFGKAWREEAKLTEEQCKAGCVGKLVRALVCTFVFTAVLDGIIVLHGADTVMRGARLGLLIGIGFAAALQLPGTFFEGRTCRYRAIVVGHNVLLCVLAAAILAVYR